MKRSDDGRNEAGGHDSVRANAQFASRRVGQLFDFFDALSQLVEGGEPVLQQCGAEDRRLGAMTIAVEQAPTDLSFEVWNDLGYDGLGYGEVPRGLGHAPLLSHRLQDVQIA